MDFYGFPKGLLRNFRKVSRGFVWVLKGFVGVSYGYRVAFLRLRRGFQGAPGLSVGFLGASRDIYVGIIRVSKGVPPGFFWASLGVPKNLSKGLR